MDCSARWVGRLSKVGALLGSAVFDGVGNHPFAIAKFGHSMIDYGGPLETCDALENVCIW